MRKRLPSRVPVVPTWKGDGIATRSATLPIVVRSRSERTTTKRQCAQIWAFAPAKRKTMGAPHCGHWPWRSKEGEVTTHLLLREPSSRRQAHRVHSPTYARSLSGTSRQDTTMGQEAERVTFLRACPRAKTPTSD